jgi:hypothetical protein
MGRYSNTRVNSRTIRFYDQASSQMNTINIEESMTAEQKAYLALNKVFSSNQKTVNVTSASGSVSASLDWESLTLATPPAGFPALSTKDFNLFINGVVVENDVLDSVTQTGSNVLVTLNGGLNYVIDSDDEYMISGKFAD